MLLNTRTYNRYSTKDNAVSFAGPANTRSSVDRIEFRRVEPKVSKDNNGVARPSCKFEKSVLNETTGKVHKVIFTIAASVPVDAAVTDALVGGMVDDLASYLATADADKLFTQNVIEPA